MTEIWKTIPCFEGAYEASNLGRVRSVARVVMRRTNDGTIAPWRFRSLVLQQSVTHGHPVVSLGRKRGNVYVHAAVMLAFVGPPPPGLEVRHLDGDKTNNVWPDNLEYATRGRNTQDKKWHDGAANYKLEPTQVYDIKRRLKTRRETCADLADEFGVSRVVISHIKHNRIHKDVVLL